MDKKKDLNPRFVSGGLPGLGRRSSKWFRPEPREEDEHPFWDSWDTERAGLPQVDPIEMMDVMLRESQYLSFGDYQWVRDVDRTVADFDGPTALTPRQTEVVTEIFLRYLDKGGPPPKNG